MPLKATIHIGNSRQSENNVSHPKEEMKAKVAYSRMLWISKGKSVQNEGKNNREHHVELRSSMFLRGSGSLGMPKWVLAIVTLPKEVVET